MSTNKKIFLAVFALFIAGLNIALYSWAHSLEAEEVGYLKNVSVWKLAVDRENKLWALVREKDYGAYENIELRVYENGTLTQSYQNINIGRRAPESLIVDSAGLPWILWLEGVVALDNGQPRKIPKLPEQIKTISVDSHGQLWFSTRDNDGLYIFNGNALINYTVENSDLIGDYVTGVAFDNQGRVWIASDNRYGNETIGGVNVFDGNNWQTYASDELPILGTRSFAVVLDGQNRAWLGTNKEIAIFDGDGWTSYPTNTVHLETEYSQVFSMIFDSQERVWVNHTRVFDGKTWKYFLDPYHSGIRDATADNDGNILIATDNGVVIVRPNSPQPISFGIGILGLSIKSGALYYLTVLLLVAWISAAFNAWQTIGVSLLSLPVYLLVSLSNATILYIEYQNGYEINSLIVNPAVFGLIGGIVGGAVEISFRRHGNAHTKRWGLIGFTAGTVLGFCAWVLPGFFVQ